MARLVASFISQCVLSAYASVGTLMVAFLDQFCIKIGIDVRTPKGKRSSLGSILHHTLPYFVPQNILDQEVLKTHANTK